MSIPSAKERVIPESRTEPERGENPGNAISIRSLDRISIDELNCIYIATDGSTLHTFSEAPAAPKQKNTFVSVNAPTGEIVNGCFSTGPADALVEMLYVREVETPSRGSLADQSLDPNPMRVCTPARIADLKMTERVELESSQLQSPESETTSWGPASSPGTSIHILSPGIRSMEVVKERVNPNGLETLKVLKFNCGLKNAPTGFTRHGVLTFKSGSPASNNEYWSRAWSRRNPVGGREKELVL